MVYFNYKKNQVLLLDQDLPEVANFKLYYKGAPQTQDKLVVLDDIRMCKWMKREINWMSCNND